MFRTNFSLITTSVVTLWFLFIENAGSLSSQACQKIDSCSCRFDNGDTIDLHHSADSKHGIPLFYYKFPQSSDVIKYSPCRGFPCGEQTDDSSLCVDDSFLKPSIDLGTVSSAEFLVSGKDIALIYASNDTQRRVTSLVRLECNSVERFVLDTNTSTVFNFTLFSPCACPGACEEGRPVRGMSVGTVLLLIFFSVLTLYFGIGCLYRKAVYGGSCRELIPHREFWCSLPLLIRDGYMFFISPCIGNRAEYRTYDKL